jgi:hypothetical protein
MQHTDREDVIVTGWLNGDDYEAALAYRRRDPATPVPAATPVTAGRLADAADQPRRPEPGRDTAIHR